MTEQNNGLAILELVAKNEEAIAILYRTYANKYAEHENLWNQLAREEDLHASWLRNHKNKLGNEEITINVNRFPKEAIQTFSSYLQSEAEKAQKEQMPVISALSISLYIEEALIERGYYEVVESDSVAFQHTMSEVLIQENAHRRRLKEVWQKARNI